MTDLIFDDVTIEKIFGAEDAENEVTERFLEYFFYNKAYANISNEMPIRLLVGHKGVGKSALLKKAYLEERGKNRLAVWIQPNDVESIRDAKEDLSFNSLVEAWKSGINRAVAEHAANQLFSSKSKPIPTDQVSVKSGLIESLLDAVQHRLGDASNFVNQALLAKFRNEKTIHIFIDDIDRGWRASKRDIESIGALLNAIRDLCGEDTRLRIRLALRSDVYFLVRTADESTDKIERNIVWLDWSNHEILCIIAKRITTYFSLPYTDEQIKAMPQIEIDNKILGRVIDTRFNVGKGHWANRPIHNVLLSLCRKRPRDLVKLMIGAAKKAYEHNHGIITSRDLEETFEHYSEERLQDIENEFRSELPQIRSLLLSMRPQKKAVKAAESYRFANDELATKLNNVLQNVKLTFADNRPVTAQTVTHFLYKIDFITARIDRAEGIERKYFDQKRFLADKYGDFGNDWEVHPAYRWALQPKSVLDVLSTLDL